MKSSNKPIKAELDELSKELSKRKEEDDYFEQDIERLSKRLEQIQSDLKTRLFPAIRINLTTIDWSKIIQVTSETSKHNVIHQQQSRLFVGGTLLSKIHQVQLNRLYGNENQTWELIYKATKNGFDTKICHRCCDKRGSTITVIQSSEGYLFGGYTTVSSDAKKNVWMNDKTAFLFTLINPYNIPPTKYPINSKGENAILSSFRTGPIFGHFDICIYLQKNRYGDSFSEFPTDYIDSTGKGNLTFTGSETFSIADIEIYYLDSKKEEQLTI